MDAAPTWRRNLYAGAAIAAAIFVKSPLVCGARLDDFVHYTLAGLEHLNVSENIQQI
jgi:hypothetical protein